MMNFIRVIAEWDSEVQVWTATSLDVPGLVAEAASIEALHPKVLAMISDLIEDGAVSSNLTEIPLHIIANRHDSFRNPVAA
jgi:Domain of unknown function (DUF1902)